MNPVIVPHDVDHFNEISEAQILNIDSKIPEIFQDFLSAESFSEIGKNVLKYTNLLKNLALRVILMTIFLLSPVFAKKYENLSWKSITTRAQKKKQQEKAKNLNQDENPEELIENISSKPFVKKPQGRPRKQINEDELLVVWRGTNYISTLGNNECSQVPSDICTGKFEIFYHDHL